MIGRPNVDKAWRTSFFGRNGMRNFELRLPIEEIRRICIMLDFIYFEMGKQNERGDSLITGLMEQLNDQKDVRQLIRDIDEQVGDQVL